MSTLSAGDALIASTIPSTSRFGRIDVYSEPGPITTSSALRIACAASGFLGSVWFQENLGDGSVLLRDLGLAFDGSSVNRCDEGDVLEGGGHDRAFDREHFARLAQGVLEVAGHISHGHDEEVAEGMTVERSLLEPVVEQLLHQRLGVRQCDEALAKVTGRQDAVLATQPAGGAAVVGHRDDDRKVRRVRLEAAEQRAEPRASTDGDDAWTAALQSKCVYHVDDAARAVAGQEGAQDGLRQLYVAEEQETEAESSEDDRARPVGPELQGYVIELRG